MPKRTILLVPTIVAILVAAVVFTCGSAPAEPAADDCLSKPNGPSPQGSHWFYRVDRANNNRHCWYLGPQGAKTRQAVAPKQRQSATPKEEAPAENRSEAGAGQNSMLTDAPTSSPTFTKPAASPERGPASARDTNTNEQVTSESQEMPSIWPVLTPADLAAAERPATAAAPDPTPEPAAADRAAERSQRSTRAGPSAEPSVKPAHVLAIAGGALLLVAIFFRAIYKLSAVRQRRHPRRNRRDQWHSAAHAGRARKSVAPVRAGIVEATREADPVAMSDAPGIAHETGSTGLIDAVLQRVRSTEASISPTGSHPRASRPVASRRMAAFG
jgi:hypothetical protein